MDYLQTIDTYIFNNILLLAVQMELGQIIDIHEITGGVAHRTFICMTRNSMYVIKLMSRDMMMKENEIEYHENSQMIAREMENLGINIVAAIPNRQNRFVTHIDQDYFMVYPWISASNAEKIDQQHCFIAGTLLSQFHRLTSPFVGESIRKEQYRKFNKMEWEVCVQCFVHNKIPTIKLLKLLFMQIRTDWCYSHLRASDTVISHCDLTPHNILWEGGHVAVIDWDAAGYINKNKDLLQTLISWCMVKNRLDAQLVESFIKGYLSGATGVEIKQTIKAYYSTFYEEIEWLEKIISERIILGNELCEKILNILEKWDSNYYNLRIIKQAIHCTVLRHKKRIGK